jgi:hydrogenase maturation protein HypF
MSELHGARIHITGIVQGVGFRPFVYGLARRFALTGWVRNTSAGVDIEVDGAPAALSAFVKSLRAEAPALAQINSLDWEARALNGYSAFNIVASEPVPDAFQPISPDVGICADCLRELFDPHDRRYHYPFINCTHCGPRFTIITDIPYDRPNTTMASFAMCPDCAAEYADPSNRRFHAQPIACPECGPQVWLEVGGQGAIHGRQSAAIAEARRLLSMGAVVAVKGLGGFHLACDATNPAAVARLRRRKSRLDKPFALMMPDLAAVASECVVNDAERALLESHARPIVILRRRPGAAVAAEVAPAQDTLGVMLPYTPLHHLLLEASPAFPQALVMTSGNLSEEPIASDNAEARARLALLADAFLMHDRDIHTRCDDSVVRVISRQLPVDSSHITDHRSLGTAHLRRSRGYAPSPVGLPFAAPPLLAVGAELKNTFCLARDRYAFVSQHIGDLENYETLRAFEQGVTHFERLFRIRPEAIAYDLHPNYLATRYAIERAEREGLPTIGVQHHHAHIAACMADHQLTGERPVIGVAFDGTGYGEDDVIWGGEFLLADYHGYQRLFHLEHIRLPGGEAAVHEPWRIALAWLDRAGVDWSDDLPPIQFVMRNAQLAFRNSPSANISALHSQLLTGLNSPLTSSMGRLFDAVSALAGVREKVNYEAQAAIELERLADPAETTSYAFEIGAETIDPAPVIRAVTAELRAGVPVPTISARFHNGVAVMVLEVCRLIRDRDGVSEVALSGGVWQNVTVLSHTVERLRQDGFTVYVHQRVPANDGGLALGQLAVAVQRMTR